MQSQAPTDGKRALGEQSWAGGVPGEDALLLEGYGAVGLSPIRAHAQQEFGLEQPWLSPPRGLGQSHSVGRTRCTARKGGIVETSRIVELDQERYNSFH